MKLKNCFLLLIFWCIGLCAMAQPHISRLGKFQVDENKGCASLTVNVSIIAPAVCNGVNPCSVIFGDGQSEPLQAGTLSHIYTQPGTYKLEILFQGGSGTDDIMITVFPNIQPAFELYACKNREVTVNVTDRNYTEYIIDYDDGASATVNAASNFRNRHTFATVGSKTIQVRGRNPGADDNCSFSEQSIIALETITAPTATLLQVLTPTSIQLDYSAQPNILYRIEIATNNSSTFQLYKTTYNVTSEIISNLTPDNNYYCFRVGAVDACDNQILYSNTICSANFDLSIQNNSNNLTWVTNTSVGVNFTLQKEYIIPNTTSSTTEQVAFVTSPYSDTDIVCGTNYCYTLITNYGNGIRSISLEKCGDALSTDPPLAIENISSTVTNPGVVLEWLVPSTETANDFTVYRMNSATGGNIFLAETPTPTVTDPSYLTEERTCYKILYDDVCGNTSPLSAAVCPIQLLGSAGQDNIINLTWSPYDGYKNGVSEYLVEKYSKDGELLQTFPVGTTLAFTDDSEDLENQLFRYVVKANAVDAGVAQSISNVLVVIKNSNIYYPTAFTPNADGLNDIFNVFGKYILKFEMNIFNRWGELVYTATSLDQGWNGTYNGKQMPEGTYTFVAQITDQAGRTFKKSGSVLLLDKE